MAARDSAVHDKSFAFAVRVVNMARHLQGERREFVLSKQVLRSGTSVGANVEEARAAQSRKDFIAKMAIASKEARETRYWLRLLAETSYLESTQAQSMLSDCEELMRMLTAIVKTSQEGL
ncbi:MAG: four helix bundle protein [Chromatiales bacterium]|nr:four helix bundle protein [Chromatiales bacterium]